MEETTMQWLQSLCPTIQQSIKCICVGRQLVGRQLTSYTVCLIIEADECWTYRKPCGSTQLRQTQFQNQALYSYPLLASRNTHTYIQTQTNQITHSSWFLTHSLSLSSVHILFSCLFFTLLLWCHQTFLIRFVFLSLLCFQLLCQTHRRFKRNLFKWLKF